MGDLGRIKVRVTVGATGSNGAPPGMDTATWYSAQDISAKNAYEYYYKRLEKPPQSVEFIEDSMTGGYIVVPRRKSRQVANYMSGASSSASMADPRVVWTAATKTASDTNVGPAIGAATGTPVGSDAFIINMLQNKNLELLAPSSAIGSTRYPGSYAGPRWDIPRGMKMVVPDVTGMPPGVSTSTTSGATSGTTPTTAVASPDDFSTPSVAQEAIDQDIWWSIETTSLSGGNTGTSGTSGNPGGTGETTSTSANPLGTPFWLYVTLREPLPSKQPTFLALRIGNSSTPAASPTGTSATTPAANTSTATPSGYSAKKLIDIIFVEGSGVVMYDWGVGATTSGSEPVRIDLPFQNNLRWDGSRNVIGIFPIGGRLCISLNGADFLYTRINTSGSMTTGSSGESGGSGNSGEENGGSNRSGTPSTEENVATIFCPTYDKIRLIGSNSQAVVNLSSMIFDRNAVLHTPMLGGYDPSTKKYTQPLSGNANGFEPPSPGGGGTTSVSMMELPGGLPSSSAGSGVSTSKILGACAKTVIDSSGSVSISGDDQWGRTAMNDGFAHGTVTLSLEDNTSGNDPVNTTLNKHYVITLTTDPAAFGTSTASASVSNDPILPPAWFRMRGIGSSGGTSTSGSSTPGTDVSTDVMEISESFSSPDRYHTVHSMDIVLYNENGAYDSLIEKSSPVQVGYAWEPYTPEGGGSITMSNVFTGVIMYGSKSLVAGKETVSLHCEDYMAILEATLVINSPYYDGMDAFYVIWDLASRAGITVYDDTVTEEGGSSTSARYFVPSGYSFLEPVKHYSPQQTVKECILDVCALGCKVVYFDGDGKLRFNHIQGGVAYSVPSTSTYSYMSNPVGAADDLMVLDERRGEVKLNSTVNHIFIKSMDRTTRAMIMQADKADAASDRLTYRKIMFIHEPALGSYAAVNNQIERLKARVYRPIQGITIKTAHAGFVLPQSYISVDGEQFRVMSLNRAIRTDDNSITTTISGEWMGARSAIAT